MTNINRLASQDTVNNSDLVPIWASKNGDARRITVGNLSSAIQALIQEATVAGITEDVTENVEESLAQSSGSSLVGFLQAGTGAAERTTQAKMRERMTVEDFGAAGNGSTDDSNAIERALNSGAGVVEFASSGTYKITRPIVIGVSNVTVRGNGAKVLQSTVNTSGIVIGQAVGGAYTKAENIRVEGLRLWGSDDGQGSNYGVGITVRSPTTNPYVKYDGCNRIHIEGNEFSGWCMSVAATAVTELHFHRNTSRDTYYHAALSAGGYGLIAQTCFDVFATGNKFLSVAKASPSTTTDRHAFYISADPSRGLAADNVCKGVYLAGNTIDWYNTHPVTGFEVCMALRGVSNLRVANNHFQGGVQGVVYNSENAVGSNIVIEGNTFDAINSPTSEGGPINIFRGSGVNVTQNVAITGNTLNYSGAQAHGIQLSYVNGATVGSNTINSSGTVISALNFDTSVSNLTISPNTIIGGTFNRAVRFAGTGNDSITIHKQQIKVAAGIRYGFVTVPTSLRFAFPRSFQVNSDGVGGVTVTAGVESPVASVASHANGFSVTFDGSVSTASADTIGIYAMTRGSTVSQVYIHSTSANVINFGVMSIAGAAMPAATNAYNIQVAVPF